MGHAMGQPWVKPWGSYGAAIRQLWATLWVTLWGAMGLYGAAIGRYGAGGPYLIQSGSEEEDEDGDVEGGDGSEEEPHSERCGAQWAQPHSAP